MAKAVVKKRVARRPAFGRLPQHWGRRTRLRECAGSPLRTRDSSPAVVRPAGPIDAKRL